MADGKGTKKSNQFARFVTYGMIALVGLHTSVLVVPSHSVGVSRGLTAAVAFLAGLCAFWRARWLATRERAAWRWAGAGMVLWGLAHTIETVVGHSSAASNLAVDASDFVYIAAAFPLLMAFSTTRETESLRAIFALNCAQIGLALVLTYVLLFKMPLPAEAAAVVMGRIYAVVCGLLAAMATLRAFAWATAEERYFVRWMCVFLWTYLPIELAMDYATEHHGLRAGYVPDLAWSIPFLLAGWRAVYAPIDRSSSPMRRPLTRRRLLVEALCPLLITTGIVTLAAAVTREHPVLGLGSIFALLAVQGAGAAVVQMNYLTGRNLLLEQEHDLRTANAALEELSTQDPLTGIANRRRFTSALETAWRRALRSQRPLALLMIDVDYFKGVNDLHGHSYGDECLKTLAGALEVQARRPDDLAARIGGEEFVLLLPDTDVEGASDAAKRVHEVIAARKVANDASPYDRRLTVSIGVAVWRPEELPEGGKTIDRSTLVGCADQSLYQAKGQGRNQTCVRVVR
jgi:diguanylate cyclase (GGDEF)-like protein